MAPISVSHALTTQGENARTLQAWSGETSQLQGDDTRPGFVFEIAIGQPSTVVRRDGVIRVTAGQPGAAKQGSSDEEDLDVHVNHTRPDSHV